MTSPSSFKAGCATSHPLAVEAGLAMLRQGGNAVDAAVAMAATLTVVEPTSNGIGGDVMAMVWEPGAERPVGLNASGRSPRGLTLEVLNQAGYGETMPLLGWLPVTVPGAPSAWVDLSRRFGTLEFQALLEPAIRSAREGFRVEPTIAGYWERSARVLGEPMEAIFAPWRETFLVEGKPPPAGARVVLKDHARTLASIAESEGTSFYHGELAQAIDAYSQETGGLLRAGDLAAHTNLWVEPMTVGYRSAELWELPPNGQGLAALIAAAMLDGMAPPSGPEDVEGVHRGIEAMKLAFADVHTHVADPDAMIFPPQGFLEPDTIQKRRKLIGDYAGTPDAGFPLKGGTVFLVAVDAEGLMVSYIQSNYMGFGSGIVVPGTGIALQNRGVGFVLDPAHPRCVGPGRRAFHTIIPGFLSRGGKPWGPMGVMGGHMQAQGHLQVLQGLVDYGYSPQQVLDMPRWRWEQGTDIYLEDADFWDDAFRESLSKRGHSFGEVLSPGGYGRGQIMLRNSDGTYDGGSDPRADGCVGTL